MLKLLASEVGQGALDQPSQPGGLQVRMVEVVVAVKIYMHCQLLAEEL